MRVALLLGMLAASCKHEPAASSQKASVEEALVFATPRSITITSVDGGTIFGTGASYYDAVSEFMRGLNAFAWC